MIGKEFLFSVWLERMEWGRNEMEDCKQNSRGKKDVNNFEGMLSSGALVFKIVVELLFRLINGIQENWFHYPPVSFIPNINNINIGTLHSYRSFAISSLHLCPMCHTHIAPVSVFRIHELRK